MNEGCLETLSLRKDLYLQYTLTFPYRWLTAGGNIYLLNESKARRVK